MQTSKEKKPKVHRVMTEVPSDIYKKIKKLERNRQTTQTDIIRKAVYLFSLVDSIIDSDNKLTVIDKSGKELNYIIF